MTRHNILRILITSGRILITSGTMLAALGCGPRVDGELTALAEDCVLARTADGPVDAIGRTSVHGGVYLDGDCLADPPVPVDAQWLDQVRGDAMAAPPEIRDRFVEARDYADRRMRNAWDFLEAHFSDTFVGGLLMLFGFDATELDFATEHSLAFEPERARWLRWQWAQDDREGDCVTRTTDEDCNHVRYEYADPMHFDEIRDRGARLYCAARETYAQAPRETVVMGRQPTAAFEVMGLPVELMIFEPTISMDGPAMFLGGDPNTPNAYAIPLHLGTRLQPSNFIPGLPELRVPVTLVTGDGELRMESNSGRVQKWVGDAETGHDESFTSYQREWQTATHADAFLLGGAAAEVTAPTIPLFKVGPVGVGLRLGMELEIGVPDAPNDRLLEGEPPGWPRTRSGTWTGPADLSGRRYYDGWWRLSQIFPVDYTVDALTEDSSVESELQLAPFDPFTTRAIQDNDKALMVRTSVGVTGTLVAGAAWIEDRFELAIEVGGGIGGSADQYHEIREQAEITSSFAGGDLPSPHPVTGLTVTPRTGGTLYFDGLSADLAVRIKILGEWVDIGGPLFRLGEAPLASFTGDRWDEISRLRIGTASGRGGDVRTGSLARSHWPRRSDFPSFEMGVEECLRAPELEGSAPAPCSPAPARALDSEPEAHLCAFHRAFAVGELSPAITPEEHACIGDLLDFLNDGVHRRQSFEYDHDRIDSPYVDVVDARVLDLEGEEIREYFEIADRCGEAFGPDRVDLVLFMHACRADGTLLEGEDFISPDVDVAFDPSDRLREAGACHEPLVDGLEPPPIFDPPLELPKF